MSDRKRNICQEGELRDGRAIPFDCVAWLEAPVLLGDRTNMEEI